MKHHHFFAPPSGILRINQLQFLLILLEDTEKLQNFSWKRCIIFSKPCKSLPLFDLATWLHYWGLWGGEQADLVCDQVLYSTFGFSLFLPWISLCAQFFLWGFLDHYCCCLREETQGRVYKVDAFCDFCKWNWNLADYLLQVKEIPELQSGYNIVGLSQVHSLLVRLFITLLQST